MRQIEEREREKKMNNKKSQMIITLNQRTLIKKKMEEREIERKEKK